MLQWLNTLSVEDVTDVDVAGVTNVDEWLERLWDAGHAVIATSGSSGKCSFLNHTMGDRARKTRHFKYSSGWPFARADADHAYFWLGPSAGRTSAVEAFLANAENWGRPGEVFALSDEPLLISEISEMAAFRTRMANGTATPDEIAAVERRGQAKAERMQVDLAKLTEKILEYRDRPIFLSGMWSQHLMIIERARELGVGDGEFHPDSVIGAGWRREGRGSARGLQGAGRPLLRRRRQAGGVRDDRAGTAAAALRSGALPRGTRSGDAAAGRERRATADGRRRDRTVWSRLASGSSTSPTRAGGAA